MLPKEEANPKVLFIESWKNSLIKIHHQQNKSKRMTENYLPQLEYTHPSIRRLHPVRILARRKHYPHCAEKKRLSCSDLCIVNPCQSLQFAPLPFLNGVVKYPKTWVELGVGCETFTLTGWNQLMWFNR